MEKNQRVFEGVYLGITGVLSCCVMSWCVMDQEYAGTRCIYIIAIPPQLIS